MSTFVLTLDTEEDNQWSDSKEYSLENIKQLPQFQEFCEYYGVCPTYLITYSTANPPFAANILRKVTQNSQAEIGSHLHPWFTPPYTELYNFGAYPRTYPSECPEFLLYQKLALLTNSVVSVSGQMPKVYRAGRYGLDTKTVAILLKLGYKVDTSVTPFYDWSKRPGTFAGGPCFSDAPLHPYYLSLEDICKSDSQEITNLLEVPITIRWPDRQQEPIWLRPYPWTSSDDLLHLCTTELEKGTPILNMMFHSSELLVGGSPYTPDEESVNSIYTKLSRVFQFLIDNNVPAVTLSDFSANYQHSPTESN